MNSDDLDIIRGSGHLFRDLRRPNPDLLMAKATISGFIADILNRRALSDEAAAEAAGASVAEIADLLHPRLSGFTLERLFEIAHRLAPATEITLGFREAAPAMQLDPETPHAAAAE